MPLSKVFLFFLFFLSTILPIYSQQNSFYKKANNPLTTGVIANEGHLTEIAQLDICGAGKFAISRAQEIDVAANAPLKLWNLSSARLMYNLSGVDYAFSPDKQILYINQVHTNQEVIKSDEHLIILDLLSLSKIKGHNYKYRINQISLSGHLALSYDFRGDTVENAFIYELENNRKVSLIPGKLLKLASNFSTALVQIEGKFKIYDVSQNKWLASFQTMYDYNYHLSENGETAVTFDENKVLYVWKKKTNRIDQLKHFTDCLVLSPDGKLALLKNDTQTILFNLEKNTSTPLDTKEQTIWKASFNKNSTLLSILFNNLDLTLYDNRGNHLKHIKSIFNINLNDAEITLDLENSLLAGYDQEKFISLDFSKDTTSFVNSNLAQSYIPAFCRTNQQNSLLICEEFYDEETRKLRAWDLKSGKPINSFLLDQGQNSPPLANLHLSDHFIALPNKTGFDIYNLISNKLVLKVAGKSIDFSKDSLTLLVSEENRVTLYSLETFKPTALFQHNQNILNAKINEKKNLIVILDQLGSLSFVDTITCKEIFAINKDLSSIKRFVLGDEGKILVTFHIDQINIWLLEDLKKPYKTIQTNTKTFGYLSADESTLLLIDKSGKGEVWQLKEGSLVSHLGKVADSGLLEVNISSSGDLAAINGVIWDLRTAKALNKLTLGYATLLKDNKAILATLNGYELWDIDKNVLLLTIRNYENGWLVYTPKGFFDGSKESKNLLSWQLITYPYLQVSNNEIEKHFHIPNLLNSILQNN
jgi:hypothetical protein